jgi:FtsH-binding integral membrane protein
VGFSAGVRRDSLGLVETPAAPELTASLGRVRWATAATLVVCALVSWLQGPAVSALSPAVAPLVTPIAILFAVGIMGARQLALRSAAPRTRLYALLTTYLLCAGLGVFGVALVLAGDEGTRGALYALGAAIFCIGSPPGYTDLPRP